MPKRYVGKYIDAITLAAYLGLSVDTIYRAVGRKKIPHLKLGRRTKFDVEEIETWLKDRRVLLQ